MKLPRFTLRDLFWLILVAAILFAWARDHVSMLFQVAEHGAFWEQQLMNEWKMKDELENLGYTINETEEGIEIIRPASDVEQAIPAVKVRE